MPVQVKTMLEWDEAGIPGLLSIVIPAHNEDGHISGSIRNLAEVPAREGINYEIIVVNDNSSANTEHILQQLQAEIPGIRCINNTQIWRSRECEM